MDQERRRDPVAVFLVEDHLVVREGIRRLLEFDGRARVVGEAGSGEEALEDPALALCSVVLVDIVLPGMDGIETTRRLVAQRPNVPVVILSSFGDTYLRQALEAGATGYILKRATQQELVEAVLQAADGAAPIDPYLNRSLLTTVRNASRSGRGPALTERQKAILRLVGQGATSREVAASLFISPATLKRELGAVFGKLQVNNRSHAVAEAQRQGLI